MIEEDFLVAGLDRIVEHVLAFGVAEANELFVPFYALRVDGSDVVVADAFADGPCGVILVIIGECWHCIGVGGEGWGRGRAAVCGRWRWWWWRLGRWAACPDEFAVPVALGENADEAGFAVEDSSDVGGGDAGVAPCGGDCEAHEVSGEMSHAVV